MVLAAAALAGVSGAAHAADYPLNLTMEAKATSGTRTASAQVMIHVDRLMEPSRYTRVTDALKHGGYGNFLPALRALPAIGSIQLDTRKVSVRYAHEETSATGRRLVIIADRPLFFLGADASLKPKAGYEMTMIELLYDAQGAVSGRMTGAARVKTSPDGPQLDDYAEAPIQLTMPAARR